MTTIQTFDDANDVNIEDCIAAVNQAGEADVSTVVGALFNGDHGSGDPEYKRVRTLLNDAADDGIIGKKRDGNRNVYTQKTGIPEPEVGGDGEPVTDTPEQVDGVTSEDLPPITREHATGLDDLADEVPDDVDDNNADDDTDDESDSQQKGVSVPERGNSYDHAERIQEHEANTCTHKTDEHPLSKQDEDRDVCVWWHGAIAIDGERDDYDLTFGPLVDIDDEGNIVGSEDMGQDDDPIHISDARFECKHCGSVRTLWHAKSRGEGIWDMSKHSPTQPRNDSQPHFRLDADNGEWRYIPHADHRDEDEDKSVE